MNLIGVQTSGHHSNLKQNLITLLQWNASEAANFYIITVSPSVVGPAAGSSIITSNTTVEFSVLYSQEYNISVVASNCVGNSTPAEIMILIVPCKKLIIFIILYAVMYTKLMHASHGIAT